MIRETVLTKKVQYFDYIGFGLMEWWVNEKVGRWGESV